MRKKWLTELAWLAFSAAVTPLVLVALLKEHAFHWDGTLDFNFHDTYLIVATWKVLLTLFFGVAFLVYFGKEALRKFSRPLPNFILLFFTILLLVPDLFFARLFYETRSQGWTVYPPLSELPQSIPPGSYFDGAAQLLTWIAVFLSATLVLVATMTVIHWRKTKRAQ